CPQDYTTFTF
nr:immunoglobulin light chain junction region [Macaca mulatta]MOX90032.1 immunoglobulin light chain junction region [Macaca mulatta]